jgi:hypothetical protein
VVDKKFELGLAGKKMTADLFCFVFKPMEGEVALPKDAQSDVLVRSGDREVHEPTMSAGKRSRELSNWHKILLQGCRSWNSAQLNFYHFLMGYRQSPPKLPQEQV